MIRRATPDDVEVVAALFRRSFQTLDFLPVLHTADEDSRTVGFIALDGNLGTFFYVDPEFHDRGIGSALFEQVREARPDGFEFWVFQANERARRFYERRGCAPVKFTEGEGNEEKTPDVLYAWKPSG